MNLITYILFGDQGNYNLYFPYSRESHILYLIEKIMYMEKDGNWHVF